VVDQLIVLSASHKRQNIPKRSVVRSCEPIKNSPRTGLAVDSYSLPTAKSRDTNTETKIKNPARYALGIVP